MHLNANENHYQQNAKMRKLQGFNLNKIQERDFREVNDGQKYKNGNLWFTAQSWVSVDK